MHITPRNHYAYRCFDSVYHATRWLTPLDTFRNTFTNEEDPNGDSLAHNVELETLIEDMYLLAEYVGWVGGPPKLQVYVFFVPDGYSPKFGLVWHSLENSMFVVSPVPLPHLETMCIMERQIGPNLGDIEHVVDPERFYGPCKLPMERR